MQKKWKNKLKKNLKQLKNPKTGKGYLRNYNKEKTNLLILKNC